MGNIETILSLVFTGVAVIAYIIVAILAIKRKKSNGEAVDADEELEKIATTVLGLIGTAEAGYASVQRGGALKQKDVLGDIKELCEQSGIAYKKNYWIDFINKAVELLNFNKNSNTSAKEIIE